MKEYGHWDTSLVGDFDPLDYYGFVYLVTNILSGRMYIGKKSMWSTTTKKVWKVDRSAKKTVSVIKESEWKSYTTSSVHINKGIEIGEQFTFQILSLHTCKGTLAYNEVDQMVKRDVLRAKFANGDRLYYNGCIPGIKFLPAPENLKWSEERKAKASKQMKENNPTNMPGVRAKLSKAGKGRRATEETKEVQARAQSPLIFITPIGEFETRKEMYAAYKGKYTQYQLSHWCKFNKMGCSQEFIDDKDLVDAYNSRRDKAKGLKKK